MPIVPRKITAGLTFDLTIAGGDYPSPGWVVSLILRGPAAVTLTATPAVDGDHSITASAAATQSWTAGAYAYSLRAIGATSGEVVEIESGQTEIAVNLAGVTGTYDPRGHAQRMLDAIEAVLERRATLDQERYRINNRELWRTPVAELLRLRSMYRAEVQRAGRAQNGTLFQNVKVRFRAAT